MDEHNHELVEILHVHLIHQIHEVSWSISQPKLHDCVYIKPVSGSESCLGNI
jgi:hypothetical protein